MDQYDPWAPARGATVDARPTPPPLEKPKTFFWLHGSHFATVFWPVGVPFSPCEGILTTMVQNISTLPDNIIS